MKKLSRLIILVIIMSFFTNMTAFAGSHTQKITVTVNNKSLKYNASPYISKGEVMIPLRQTAEALGASVRWDRKNKTAWLDIDMMHLELVVGKSEFYIHRDADFSGIPETVKLKTSIKFTCGKIFVPGQSVFESIGAKVSWDSSKRVLSITRDNTSVKEVAYTEISKDAIAKNKAVLNWYNANYKKEGVSFKKENNVIYVLVGAGKKPTGGYTMGIDKITYASSTKAYVAAYVKSPSPDMMVTQVETYPHMLIKLNIRNIKSAAGEVKKVTTDLQPIDVSYEELMVDDIKANSTLVKWYNENNQNQGIHYIRDGKYIYALIAGGERPTGGFTVSLDEIYYSTPDILTINARVTPPGDNVRVIMVITYPSLLIRVKTDTVKAVIGDIRDLAKEKLPALDLSTVTKMELFSLDQVKIRDLTDKEKETVMQAFNGAAIDTNFYIEMITGNTLKITTTAGYTINFTSYGSQTNVVANIAYDNDTRTFHLAAPAIAKLLLQK
ncbi:MAG: stalk domain-containing protein [Mobilitalea sp.]